MSVTKSFSKKRPEIIFLSFGLVGFLPWAPGTWGSLATLPFLYLLGQLHAPFFLFIPFTIILTVGASFIANTIQNELQLHDPGWIVIDEVIGMLTAWLFAPTNNIITLILLFILFRIFDIIKFWPASYFDQQIKHGAGTIMDDIISGIYAGIIYLSINHFLHIS